MVPFYTSMVKQNISLQVFNKVVFILISAQEVLRQKRDALNVACMKTIRRGNADGTRANRQTHDRAYMRFCNEYAFEPYPCTNWQLVQFAQFLGGLSLHLNHLIASHVANYDWPFGTLSFGLFGSKLATRSGHQSNYLKL